MLKFRQRPAKQILLLCIIGFTLSGCARRDDDDGETESAVSATQQTVDKPALNKPVEKTLAEPLEGNSSQSGTAPSVPTSDDEEYEKFAESIVDAVNAGDVEALDATFDWDSMLETSTAGFKKTPKQKKDWEEIFAGIKPKMTGEEGFYGSVVDKVRQGGSYRFLRVHLVDEQKRILFRLILPDGTLYYHDMIVERRQDGQLKNTDLYLFDSGKLMSQTMRRAMLPIAKKNSRGFLSRLFGPKSDANNNLAMMGAMGALLRKGQFEKSLDVYEMMHPSLQKNKNVLLLRLKVAMQLDEKRYQAAIDDFRKHFPNDPSIDMISIDGYVMQKQYQKALESIDRLDLAVGGDPYLKSMRADILMEQNKIDDARKMAEKAITEEPTLIDAYLTLVSISVTEKKFDDTVKWIEAIDEKTEFEFDDQMATELGVEFVKSPEYAAWMKSRAVKK